MVGAIQCRLFLQEKFANGIEHRFIRLENGDRREIHPVCSLDLGLRKFLRKCRRDMPGKCRQDRFHSKRPFSKKNLLLEFFVLIHQA